MSDGAEVTRHTPGPWTVKYGFTGLNGCRIVSRDDTHVATIARKADKPIDQKQADASLIASAPDMAARIAALERVNADMLAALKIAAQHVCSLLCPSTKKTDEAWTHVEDCRCALAAIAAAESLKVG